MGQGFEIRMLGGCSNVQSSQRRQYAGMMFEELNPKVVVL